MIHPASRTGVRPVLARLLAILCTTGLLWPMLAMGNDQPLPVVTTLPVLQDFVQQIGREHVRVISLLTGLENEHSYSPRPSDLMAVRRARLLVQIGAGLEVWTDGLIRNAGNSTLQVVTTADNIPLLDSDSPERPGATALHGHEHLAGNPHIWLDPDNALVMLGQITDTLVRLAPAHADDFRRNHAAYAQELRQTTDELVHRVEALSDRRVITHHPAWPYFARRFHLTIVGEIQTQAGSEPSPRHVQSLIDRIRREQIRVIVSEPQLSQRLPRLLAQETTARVAVLTPLPGGLPNTETYLDMLRHNVLELLRAFEER